MTRWEYEVNILPRAQFELQGCLNAIGKEGFRLVSLNWDTMTGVFERIIPGHEFGVEMLGPFTGKSADHD